MDQACPTCHQTVAEGIHFCPKCGQPLTTFATTDPVQSIRAQGQMVRRAIDRPNGLIVAGIWLLFGMPCAAMVFLVFAGVTDKRSTVIETLVGVLLSLLIIGIYIAIVVRVTRKYLASRSLSASYHDADDEESL